ncbi:MAG TPA: ThiF family adenylyltransferase [Gemmataceae bacterium]|nr:ThiF family adenylyltransferase [Gemmataceae bacterium]
MCRFTLTIPEEYFEDLRRAVFSAPGLEGAAYLLCGVSDTGAERRLLVRHVVPVAEEHVLRQEKFQLSIESASYVRVAKQAKMIGASVVFVHSHPDGVADFSVRDDREDEKLHAFWLDQIPDGVHGSLVLSRPNTVRGRVTTAEGRSGISRIRVIGRRFTFIDDQPDDQAVPEIFDRQVRAFGPDTQRLLARLHIGVIGAGGTGSAVMEELVRLGVGTMSVFDRDVFDETNVNRVYGSSVRDAGRNKAGIAADSARRTGLQTEVRVYSEHITVHETAMRLRECDLVFGCTDRHAPRAILVQLALRYYIPVIDTGVKIDSHEGKIRGVTGRVTTLMPGEACLFCRERTSADAIRLETLSPDERRSLVSEGYAPELETPAPAVIPFTTAVAAQAVTELLHRLTGFMGEERRSSEVLLAISESRVRTNRQSPNPECLCAERSVWGRGDGKRFLNMSWPESEAHQGEFRRG